MGLRVAGGCKWCGGDKILLTAILHGRIGGTQNNIKLGESDVVHHSEAEFFTCDARTQ